MTLNIKHCVNRINVNDKTKVNHSINFLLFLSLSICTKPKQSLHITHDTNPQQDSYEDTIVFIYI